MSRTPALLVPALLAALLSACSAGASDQTVTAPPAEASSGGASAPAPAPSPEARTIDVAYTGGEITGTSGREDVAVGEQVVLRITSDVAEEYHVHGYDLTGALPAGQQVEIPLTATIPGIFEVELHDAGKQLLQLRVA